MAPASEDLHLILGRLAGALEATVKRQDEHHAENRERLARMEGELRSLTLLQERVDGQGRQIRAARRGLDEQDARIRRAEARIGGLRRQLRALLWGLSALGAALSAVLLAFGRTVGTWLGIKAGFGT